MTEIAFHFSLSDKLAYSCRLLRKVCGRDTRAVVLGDAQQIGRLDQLLWTFSAADFLAHCRADSKPETLAMSPIVLTEQLSTLRVDPSQSPVLVNLSTQLPAGFEKYERLIELIGQDEEDTAQARQRWKYYKARGYAIKHHDLARSEGL